MIKHENFGKNLKGIMTKLGMTQADLAERTGLTRAAICQILKGDRDPILGTVCKILNVIPVKFETLVR